MLAGWLVGLATMSLALAQEAVQRRVAPPDPYTGGEAAALSKAGYTSLGPFPFGQGHDTRAIEELLGTEPLAWIETAHFRIGCALTPLRLKGEDDWVAKTKQELKRLSQRLPKVKADTKDLDAWLRAHLIAQRLEDLYAEVMQNLGVTDASFPSAPPDEIGDPAKFMGLGAYLGMAQKFTVLLVHQSASHARYTRAFQGREMADPIRYHDAAFGCMYFGASEETAKGLFYNDLALHAHLVFNVAHNLYACYRSFGHDLPAWVPAGLAHWHARRVTPRFPTYDRKDDLDHTMRSAFWEWDKRAPGLLANNAFEALPDFLARTNLGEFSLEKHMEAWALTDFLMTAKKQPFMRFVHQLKDPFHERQRGPSPIELEIRQQDLLQSTLGVDAKGLELQWRAYVQGAKSKK